MKAVLLLIISSALVSFVLNSDGCTSLPTASSNQPPSANAGQRNGQPSKPPVETPAKTLTPYPEGLVPGTEGWIPPLPQGMEQPRLLSEDEWNRVSGIARTDLKIAEQIENNNIKNMIRYWVGYAGGPGHYADEDSAVISGKVHPPMNRWYYPAIWFDFQTVTDRHGQLVGVDLKSERVVLSTPLGPKWAEPPYKPPPPR